MGVADSDSREENPKEIKKTNVRITVKEKYRQINQVRINLLL